MSDNTANNLLSPLTRLRRLRLRIVGGAIVVITLASLWATRPLTDAQTPPPQPAHSTAALPPPNQPATAHLNLVAFAAPIWEPPPPPPKPPAPVPPAPPPPPLRLQLLGIVRDGAVKPGEANAFVAALYDEAHDKVLLVRRGDALGTAQVTAVSNDSVDVSDSYGPRRLTLRQPPQPASPLLDRLASPPPASPVFRPTESSQ